MAKNEYPSYSIYLQAGGQLKHPYNGNKRVQIFDLNEARHAATSCWLHYKGRYDVVICRSLILFYTYHYNYA